MKKSRLLFRQVIATKRFKFSLVPKSLLPRRWFLLSELNPNRWVAPASLFLRIIS